MEKKSHLHSCLLQILSQHIYIRPDTMSLDRRWKSLPASVNHIFFQIRIHFLANKLDVQNNDLGSLQHTITHRGLVIVGSENGKCSKVSMEMYFHTHTHIYMYISQFPSLLSSWSPSFYSIFLLSLTVLESTCK